MAQMNLLEFSPPPVARTVTPPPPSSGSPEGQARLEKAKEQAQKAQQALTGEILPKDPKDPTTATTPMSARIPGALRGIDVTKLQSRAQLVQALTQTLPMNEYNLPKFIYRPDLLDYTLFQSALEITDEQLARERFLAMQDMLASATIELRYHEGYPSFENGRPFWDQFDCESLEEYELFKSYREQPGARQLGLVGPLSGLDMTELFHLHYWGLRCLAHDSFAIAHFQRLREQRVLSTENTHFLKTEELLQTLLKKANEIEWDAVKDPKAFVDIFDKLVKLQRLSLGLSSSGVSPNDAAKSPSLELIMRRITSANVTQTDEQKHASVGSMNDILGDPDLVQQAQELILRLNK